MTPVALAEKLHIHIHFLYLLSNRTQEFYRIYRIPKRNGTFRTIEAPAPILKRIQRTILRDFLPPLPLVSNLDAVAGNDAFVRYIQKKNDAGQAGSGEFIPPEPGYDNIATAFEPGSSIRANAAVHCGKPVVLELDLKDFFPSLKYAAVLQLFKELGHDPEIAVPLAKLCTLYGHLPQGAVGSPHLANLLMFDFDRALAGFCRVRGIAVTRYADDLTFSGDLAETTITELIRYCRTELRKMHLRLNPRKIRVLRRSGRQQVTGLVVNEKVGAPRAMKRALRQEMYYLNKFWETEWPKLDRHTLHAMLGRANFIWDMDRDNAEFREYRRQLQEIRHFTAALWARG